MAQIETLQQNGKNIFVGVIEFDDCQEVMENFEGTVQGERYLIDNSNDILTKLYRDNFIDKGEKISLENCDYLAFTGVKS